MRIAQIAPLLADISPAHPRPESMIWYLTEELVNQGHDVTLFATASSQTRAHLVPGWEHPISHNWPDWVVAHVLMIEQVYKQADMFDIIHNHIECFAAPLARRYKTATLSTLHVPVASDDWIVPIYEEYRELPHIPISEFQRRHTMPWLNWQDVIYYGLPADMYPLSQAAKGDYLLFFDRTTLHAGLPEAIEIASHAGMKLKVVIDPESSTEDSSDAETAARIDNQLIEYAEELSDEEKKALLGNAFALIVPSACDEPFDIVTIEALACGTPVIARNWGSLPEIIVDGVNGFIFETIEDAVAALNKTSSISRKRCRNVFEERFTVQRMASEYIALYERFM